MWRDRILYVAEMSYIQCPKCGGFSGCVGRTIYQCGCPAISAEMLNELTEAVKNNATINETTDWYGVCVDLVKKGWKR